MISIVDYGMGNLRSVQKALEFIGAEAEITGDKHKILNSRGIILPGVGAFPDAMDNIKKLGIDTVLNEAVNEGTPLMGICLGMQLLFDESEEVRNTKGLGLLKGKIKKFNVDLKIPHMGWNNLIIDSDCEILKDVKEGSYVYFVHSYYAKIQEEEVLKAHSFYGINTPAVVSKGNVFGLQFHPEKSGEPGMQMLKNFWELIK
ncbi:imidazole glycerol phosphate synthase subunit HisH [Clostridium tyrobutyricum]|uniref:Imidazole glycerol phosphate synthase subunit HisH n=1 Tax=Clostridium tyrobutyricum DIVETGP TaxID=1408889 RepID=W6N1E4_CLOTY|nr:imidazole glycerol phosphate synthase subunit HisH [Clostridium tyrobutyricum]AND85155.1 imidazole glycerol phosphate synthase subunit HisH [Clostridium tyrobutyricum]ANP69714.1 imidazole glycerol phosphate synthase, glutamine amidotransferase subunit [Clostridium tyrobutyricum]MBR9646953.1 imidazole glycerol phosphate synthase subunit HisH [Clostridium tyrobutyricum]MBV4423954.1 imidazole glycerol phosphate synthase subunit HisH [Clostridium tyrobutyricum]MBV4426831.1 imidazole glycerol ph